MHYYNHSNLSGDNTWIACPTIKYLLVFSHHKKKRGMSQWYIYSRMKLAWEAPASSFLLPWCSSFRPAPDSRFCRAAVWGLKKLSGLRINHFFPIYLGGLIWDPDNFRSKTLAVPVFTLCTATVASECHVIWQALPMFHLARIKGWDSPALFLL